MNCPVDQTILVMTERQGVEIDYCPTCRGVWLDRGELDKVIDRSSNTAPDAPAVGIYRDRDDDERRDRDDDDRRSSGGGLLGKVSSALNQREGDRNHQGYDSEGKPRKKKKDSLLEDLFDV